MLEDMTKKMAVHGLLHIEAEQLPYIARIIQAFSLPKHTSCLSSN